MKKKIGEIYNKPIVTGDKNLVTKNEIHESSLGGNSGGGEGGVKEYCYKVITQEPNIVSFMTQIGVIYFIVEVKGEIKETLSSKQFSNYTYAFKLLDIPSSFVGTDEGNIVNVYGGFNGDIYDRYLRFGELSGATDVTREDAIAELSQYIQEITKEEYESLITQ